MIYRLFTKNTIEEGVIERARKKLLLEHLIVQKMGKELKVSYLRATHTHTCTHMSLC